MYLTSDSALEIKIRIAFPSAVFICRGGDSLFIYWELHLVSSCIEVCEQSKEISSLENTVAALREDYERCLSANASSQRDLQENLISSKHELLRVQEQLALAEKVHHCCSTVLTMVDVRRFLPLSTFFFRSLCYVLCTQELEKKFQQTAAYRNMKEILTKKNEQIKEIRKRLQR